MPTIAMIGNPNSGKSALFNLLTGSCQKVGNWNGVTVNRKHATFDLKDSTCELIDLPGIYELCGQGGSTDEQVTTTYLWQQKPDLILNVVDASQLTRSLYLTLQLLELGIPTVLVLNKMDLLKASREHINFQKLSEILGCPVMGISTRFNRNINQLKEKLTTWSKQPPAHEPMQCPYGVDFETAVSQLAGLFTQSIFSNRGAAIRYLEGEDSVLQHAHCAQTTKAQQIRQALTEKLDVELLFADTRYSYIHGFIPEVLEQKGKLSTSFSERLDQVVLNRWLGIPIFLAVMYCMFMFSIQFGSAFIGFFDILAATFFVDLPVQGLTAIDAPDWLISILGYGIGTGLQTVATFIPVIFALYLFLSFLESSGYLARAAFVVDSLMRRIGLPGKAFVPMLMGFGCTVPAVMATRTLASERERLLTSNMTPFMSCGARLPVYALFAVAFFPDSGQNIVFLLYLIGIVVAIFTGLLLSKTILPGRHISQPVEIPDYEIPLLRSIFYTTVYKVKGFLCGAGKTIVIVVAILSFFNTLGVDGRLGHQGKETSLLSVVCKKITPIFAPIGIDEDNWQATVGIVTGIFAKEALVGTLNSLYTDQDDGESTQVLIGERWQEAIDSVTDAVTSINFHDPLGFVLGDLHDQQQLAQEQDVEPSLYVNLQTHFDGQVGAFAYLLFILLYMPCASAMGAMVREMGKKWAWSSAAWCNFTAFMFATLFYQFAYFQQHPLQTLSWLAIYVLCIVIGYLLLQSRGNILIKKAVAV